MAFFKKTVRREDHPMNCIPAIILFLTAAGTSLLAGQIDLLNNPSFELGL